MDAAGPAYSHTQKARLCLILYGSALACIAFAWKSGDTPGIFIVIAVGLVVALDGWGIYNTVRTDTVMEPVGPVLCRGLLEAGRRAAERHR